MTLCPERPFEALSACVREVGHEQACVFCRTTPDGAALTFYEPTPRGGGFRAKIRADLEAGDRPSRAEAAAILAVLEAAKAS